MLKRTKTVLIITIIWCFLCWVITILSFVGNVSADICGEYKGFAVDNCGNLYLGYRNHIVVLNENGERIKELRSQTQGMSDFLIVGNKYIYEYSYKRAFAIMDLDGNLIDKKIYGEDGYQEHANRGRALSRHAVEDGTVYESFTRNGRFEIYCVAGEGYELIYRMPLYDYSIKLGGTVLFIGCFILVPATLVLYFTDPRAPKVKSIIKYD